MHVQGHTQDYRHCIGAVITSPSAVSLQSNELQPMEPLIDGRCKLEMPSSVSHRTHQSTKVQPNLTIPPTESRPSASEGAHRLRDAIQETSIYNALYLLLDRLPKFDIKVETKRDLKMILTSNQMITFLLQSKQAVFDC